MLPQSVQSLCSLLLLGPQVVSVRGHAARALWNLTSKNETNKSAAREAGAISHLVAMLDHDTTKALPRLLMLQLSSTWQSCG